MAVSEPPEVMALVTLTVCLILSFLYTPALNQSSSQIRCYHTLPYVVFFTLKPGGLLSWGGRGVTCFTLNFNFYLLDSAFNTNSQGLAGFREGHLLAGEYLQ